jgi:hypothetical protein
LVHPCQKYQVRENQSDAHSGTRRRELASQAVSQHWGLEPHPVVSNTGSKCFVRDNWDVEGIISITRNPALMLADAVALSFAWVKITPNLRWRWWDLCCGYKTRSNGPQRTYPMTAAHG